MRHTLGVGQHLDAMLQEPIDNRLCCADPDLAVDSLLAIDNRQACCGSVAPTDQRAQRLSQQQSGGSCLNRQIHFMLMFCLYPSGV